MITGIAVGGAFRAFLSFIFDNPVGKAMSGGALLIGAFMVWLWTHDAKVAAEAQDKLTTQINTHAQEVTDAGIKARDAAKPEGAWDRLRKHHCRDC